MHIVTQLAGDTGIQRKRGRKTGTVVVGKSEEAVAPRVPVVDEPTVAPVMVPIVEEVPHELPAAPEPHRKFLNERQH